MKYRIFIILVVLCAFLQPAACCSEQPDRNTITPDSSWTWNPGAINQFSGEYDLSEFQDTQLSIRIESDTPEEDEAEKALVFTTLNGKRIPVLKQGNTVQFTPDADNQLFRFTGQIKLPKKHRVHDVHLTLAFYDSNGNELKKTEALISSRDTAGDRSDGTFYISYDPGSITIILSAAAAMIWAIALCRSFIIRKKKRNGEDNHADL